MSFYVTLWRLTVGFGLLRPLNYERGIRGLSLKCSYFRNRPTDLVFFDLELEYFYDYVKRVWMSSGWLVVWNNCIWKTKSTTWSCPVL